MENLAYEIFDHDIGGNIHETNGWNLNDLANEIYDDWACADWADDIELYPEDEKARLLADIKHFNLKKVIDSLKNFDFANGFCTWRCKLPGGHRELVVYLERENS